jgi:hypothetical protein
MREAHFRPSFLCHPGSKTARTPQIICPLAPIALAGRCCGCCSQPGKRASREARGHKSLGKHACFDHASVPSCHRATSRLVGCPAARLPCSAWTCDCIHDDTTDICLAWPCSFSSTTYHSILSERRLCSDMDAMRCMHCVRACGCGLSS